MWRWRSAACSLACWAACSVGCLSGCGGKSGLPQEQGAGASASFGGSGGSGGAFTPGPLTAALREVTVDMEDLSSSLENDKITIFGELWLDNRGGEQVREVDVLKHSALFFQADVQHLYEGPDIAGPIIVPAGQAMVVAYGGGIEVLADSPFDLFCFDEDEPYADVTMNVEVIGEEVLIVTGTTDDSISCF